MTATPTATEWSVPALVQRWAGTDKVAITCDDAQLTYRDWARDGERLARALVAIGIAPGERLAMLLPNGPAFAVTLYAAARAGITIVPISTWSTSAEIERVLEASSPTAMMAVPRFANHDFESELRALASTRLAPGRLWYWGEPSAGDRVDALLERAADCSDRDFAEAAREGGPRADLAILYTSGSTGAPKGVVLGQDSVCRNGAAISSGMGFTSEDRIFSYYPMFFSGGLCNALLGSVTQGAELVTQSRFEPEGALQLIRERRCTARNMWYDGLRPISEVPGFRVDDVSAMRRGLPVRAELHAALGLPPDEGVNMYGMTETCSAFTLAHYTESPELRLDNNGVPFVGTSLKIVDPGTDTPAAPGELGEICVRGWNLMRGYTDGSHERFIDEEGYFHSGDIGRVDDRGRLHFDGRVKSMIKIKGMAIQPEEVEGALLRHPAIRQAVVLGMGGGHESTRLIALINLHEASGAPLDDVRAQLRAELSSYKVPELIVVDDPLPLSASLKVDRQTAHRIADALVGAA